jgi:dihydropyrimidinase
LLLSRAITDRIDLRRICDCLTAAPARIFHIDDRKGHIRPGYDGDLTIVDLNLEREVVAAELGSYSDYSLYDGWKFRGWPVATIVRGETVMQDSRIVGRGSWGGTSSTLAGRAPHPDPPQGRERLLDCTVR